MKTKKIVLAAAIGLLGLMMSCGDSGNEVVPQIDLDKQVTVKGNATFSNITSPSGGRMMQAVSVSKFLVNIKEIELKIDEKDERSATEAVQTDPEFQGPFVVDLLSDELAVDLAGAQIPAGIYDEIKFELAPGNAGSSLDGKSALIEGEINGTPFVFWTDQTEEMEINFPNNGGDFIVGEVGFVLVINFDLELVFGVDGAIDLTKAVDGNGDGVIEIYPNDPDGNNILAVKILSKLEESTEIEEDEDLDEDGKGNDEDDDIDGDGQKNEDDDDDDNDGISDDQDSDDDGDGEDDDMEDDDDDKVTDDDDQDEQEASEISTILTSGTWTVSLYSAAEDGTALFESLTLTFNTSDDILGEFDGVEIAGEWDAITNTDSPLLILEFDVEDDHLVHILEEDWKILVMDAGKLELQKVTDEVTKNLTITKQ